jgi:DNA uptake protein ComE-like DNA-binding protein
MQIRAAAFIWSATILIASCLAGTTACDNKNPDQIRQETAQQTATMKRDTKAVVEGVKEGLNSDKKRVDLNKASRDDLTTLPGITGERADRIIAARPFASAHELVTRHVLPEDEYARIRDQITVTQ